MLKLLFSIALLHLPCIFEIQCHWSHFRGELFRVQLWFCVLLHLVDVRQALYVVI